MELRLLSLFHIAPCWMIRNSNEEWTFIPKFLEYFDFSVIKYKLKPASKKLLFFLGKTFLKEGQHTHFLLGFHPIDFLFLKNNT